MAAQKRKTTLVEDSAKRRRLDKGNKWTAATSKKKKVPSAKRSANKSKENVGTVQKKKESKSSVKPNRTGTKKARQPSRQKKTVQKQTQLSSKTPTNKTVFVKNAPIKRTTLKSPSRTACSVSKKSHANLSKSSQNNKVLKVTKSSSSTKRVKTKTSEKVAASLLKRQAQHQLRPSTTEKKCAAKTLSVQSAKSSLMKSVRMLSKTSPRTTKLDVQATRNSSRNIPVKLVETRTSNKTDLGKHMQSPKGDMPRKPAGRGTTLSLQKSYRGSPRNTQEMHICRTSRSLVATAYNVAQVDKVKSPEPRPNKRQPVSDSRRSRRLQATLDVSSKSLCNKRKSGKAKQNTAVKKGQVLKVKSRQLNQKKGNLAISRTKCNKKGKMEQEVSRNLKETKNKGVRKTQKEKAADKVDRKLSSRSSLETNPQQLKISAEQSLHQEIERDQKVFPVPSLKEPKGQAIAVQATTVKAKGGQKLGSKQALCQKVKSKLKPKLPKLQGPDIKPVQEPENDSKAKRISILELCEEIAGEIESDTVEVIKEVANAEEEETPEKPQQEHKEIEAQKLTLCDQSQSNPSKCFFPSRKALPVKCKINGKTSPTTKNSKWNKIKLKKASLMNRNHVTKPTALPNLELLKRTKKAPLATQFDSAESHCPKENSQPLVAGPQKECGNPNQIKMDETPLEIGRSAELRPGTFRPVMPTENGQISEHAGHELEAMPDETFRLHLESSPENTPEKCTTGPSPPKRTKPDNGEKESPGSDPELPVRNLFSTPASEMGEKWVPLSNGSSVEKTQSLEVNIQKEIKKLKDPEKESDKQLVIDAGQKRFGAISCNVCGMLYTASNPEDETQHLLFHNQFISAVKYVGWKKERIVAEYPDGRVIMVFPDDPKYALKKVEEIREMVDNDLGFQQVPLKLHSRTKTLLFISNDKKVAGCLIAEHIQWGYRVIDEKIAEGDSERERAISERQKAWCCSTSPEPAICGISRIWVFGMMRRKKIASRMLECLRNNFIYGSYLSKDEIAFSDPTPDGKLFATQYCETSQFLVYNFLNGQQLAS